MLKRYAARALYDGDGRKHIHSIVEVEDGLVKSFYSFTQELPATIWLEGEIILSSYSDLDERVKEDPEILVFPPDTSLQIFPFCFAYHLTTHRKARKLVRLL